MPTTPAPRETHVVMIDNQDSFVYNLVDAFAVASYRHTVFRNTIPVADVLAANPDLICLSPGPGHPRDANNLMGILAAALDRNIPVLGICLGFQALLEHFGGSVRPCGPMHGVTDIMELTEAGLTSKLFDGLTVDAGPENNFTGTQVPIARYHSLGCLTTEIPTNITPLGTSQATTGPVVMAATTNTTEGAAIGLQFHPESILSPTGPIILDRCITALLNHH